MESISSVLIMSDVMQPVALGPELFGEIDKSDVLKSVQDNVDVRVGQKVSFSPGARRD